MDVVMLSRLQFAATVFFHFIFVPLTLGLTVLLAYMQTRYYKSGDEEYKRMTKFWGKLFLINFVLGVVTGISLEFQFGTNWARYSAYVGDIFGPLLAIEASVAFFLESTFVAVWAFGWERISKRIHLFAIYAVAVATNLSALWIILANGWMQNPVGYVLRNNRAELADMAGFWQVLTNPYGWGQYFHTVIASWLLAGFFVLGVSAWHLLRKNEVDFFTRSVRIAAPFTLALSLLLIGSGHIQGNTVARIQPTKLAAMESHWETSKPADLNILVWPDEKNRTNLIEALPIPGALSFLAFNDFNAEVKGLNAFPAEDTPPVLITFLSFRLMVAMGGLFVLLAFMAYRLRDNLARNKLVAHSLIWIIPLPYLAIMAGWALAEVGRQPWIVYGLMRTKDAVSPIPASSVGMSLGTFVLVYSLLGVVCICLIRKVACKGPMPLSATTSSKGSA